MRHSMWKVHCLAVVLLTAINLYLLVKLASCSDRMGAAHWNSNNESVDDVEFDPWSRPVKRSWKFVRIKESFIGTESDEVDQVGAVWTKHARYDASRRFTIRDFALVGANYHATAVNQDVCLATQSSLDRIVSLAEATEHWGGAVSVAVYVDADEMRVFERLVRHLHRCHAGLLSNMAFHVVSAAAALPGPPLSDWSQVDGGNNGTINCTDPSEALTWLTREQPPLGAKWESGRAYPQNLMRNVARKGCPANHALLLDVDVIPTYDMADQVARFLSAAPDCAKCAYVVPTYELDYSAEFPANKSQLLAYESQGRAQPFHHKAFRYNQYASNLTRWAQTPETDRTIVSHNVTNYEFFYEPFYIARDDAPPHDERFIGYGFTRNTQVKKMLAINGKRRPFLSCYFGLLKETSVRYGGQPSASAARNGWPGVRYRFPSLFFLLLFYFFSAVRPSPGRLFFFVHDTRETGSRNGFPCISLNLYETYFVCFTPHLTLPFRKVYEMALAGWTFRVLSPLFTVHWGMQMRQRRPTWRKNQMDRNRRVFDSIHNELKVRYGLVNKSPVRWHAKPGNGKPVKPSANKL